MIKSNTENVEMVDLVSVSEEQQTEEKMTVVKEQIKETKSNKKRILSIVFFVLNICIIAGIFMYNFNGTTSAVDIGSTSPVFTWLYILAIVLSVLLDVAIIVVLIRKAVNKTKPWLAFKSFITMKYYDNITPMNVGGQPFMISYLASHEIPGTKALSIPMQKFIIQQICWVIVCVFGLISSLVLNLISSPVVIIFSVIGFVINTGMVMFILLGSTRKKFTQKIAVFFLKILSKLHIVKNYDKTLKNVISFIKDYNLTMKEFSKNKWLFIKLLLINFIKYIIYFSIPFLIYGIFKTPTLTDFYTMLLFTIMVELASSCCPLPGGTLMNELTFSALFSACLSGQVVWALLLWRLASYFIWIILGFIIICYDFFIGNKHNEKRKQMHKLAFENEKNNKN